MVIYLFPEEGTILYPFPILAATESPEAKLVGVPSPLPELSSAVEDGSPDKWNTPT
jgi:hypothetical protein